MKKNWIIALLGFFTVLFFSVIVVFLYNVSPSSYSTAIQRASPAVVGIYGGNSTDSAKATQLSTTNQTPIGSGVIVRADGVILTNYHVIQNQSTIKIQREGEPLQLARIIGIDPESDLAVLKIEGATLPFLPLKTQTVTVGDVALAIGHPFGLGQTVTLGIVSAVDRHDLWLNTYENFIQTDAAINVGNSGGALINSRGELIGISSSLLSKSGGSEGIGFAIPTKMASFVLESILTHGKVVRGWIGIESQPLSSALAQSYGIKPDQGLLVSNVIKHSPAEQAGMMRGDILLSINGFTVKDGHQIMALVANIRPNQILVLELLRQEKALHLKVVAALRPDVMKQS